MRYDFSSVTPEQRTKLFPIILTEHDNSWKERYEEQKAFLTELFCKDAVRISHIGSTSVSGLYAKPTIDILLEVSDSCDISAYSEAMLDNGWIINTPSQDIIMYLKGYTPDGFRGQAYHVHVRHRGDWNELYFRDYIIAHPETADEYAKLKMSLREQYEYDRDAYTEAKTEFISNITALAREEFGGRYK